MSKRRLLFIYVLLIGVPLIGLIGILRIGRSLSAPDSAVLNNPVAQPGAVMPDLAILVLQIAVIIAVSAVVARVFEKLRQPKVIGEMFAGIMLGPSLLGWVAPHFSAMLFPPANFGPLNGLSQVGIVIYMFLVGLALDPKTLRENGHTAVLTSHVSIVIPFVLGAGMAFFLYSRLADAEVGFTGFSLFMGSAMSITAFPVLARILAQRNMLGTKIGSLAIACAAVDDVTGWCILAYIVVLVRAHDAAATSLWITVAGLALFLLLMLTIVKRLLGGFERVFQKGGELSENVLALMILIVLFSALVTERLGLHLLFGSFLAGVVMPKEQKFVRYILDRFESSTVLLLLPLY